MKKIILGILILIGYFAADAFSVSAEEVSVSAQSAVLIEADTGRVLFEKNAHEKKAMASTTKIMTALLTLEEAAKNNRPVVITQEMVRVEGSSMGLQAGNILTLRDLAAGMLIVSGNDAANSAAYAVSGSIESFAEKMNSRAKDLGMADTNFVTPSGLDAEKHYSTAYDMALLAREAMQNESFAEIVCQSTYRIAYRQPNTEYTFTNHNKLLRYYEGCIGVKTGYTKKAGRCLVSAAERDGVRLIAVTLNAPDDWTDHQILFDFGFSQMTSVELKGSFSFQVPVVGCEKEDVSVWGDVVKRVSVPIAEVGRIKQYVELPHFLYADITVGDTVGYVRYILDDEELAIIPLKAQANLSYNFTAKNFLERIRDWFLQKF